MYHSWYPGVASSMIYVLLPDLLKSWRQITYLCYHKSSVSNNILKFYNKLQVYKVSCLHAVNDGRTWLARTPWGQWQSLHKIVKGWTCQECLQCRVDVTPIALIRQTTRLKAESLVLQLVLQKKFCKKKNQYNSFNFGRACNTYRSIYSHYK